MIYVLIMTAIGVKVEENCYHQQLTVEWVAQFVQYRMML